MLRGSLVASLLVASLLAAPGVGTAQYMYLDANGDGVNTAADVLSASGPDSLDIWLDTAHDRDGSAQTCNSHSGAPTGGAALDFFSYTIVLQAVGGAVTWGTFAAADPEYTLLGTDRADGHDTEFNRARPAGTVTSPGLTKLGTIPVEVVSGAPNVRIGTSTPIDPSGFGTGFGTNCEGNNFLNTYVLATPGDSSGDWFDTDGVGAPAVSNTPPSIAAPASLTAPATASLTISATATDPDASDVLTIAASGAPASLTLSSSPGPSPATATLDGTPTVSDAAGSPYNISWTVGDGVGGNAGTTTVLTVTRTDAPPAVSAPDSARGSETIAFSVAVSASDPDGDPITSLTAVPVPPGATFSVSAFNTAGLLSWTPATGQQGTYPVTFTAQSGSQTLSASATTVVLVGPRDRRPVVTAPASVTVNEGQALTVTATASDPDGDHVTLSAPSRPLGAGFIDHGDNTGTFDWTPGFGQAGTYTVTFAGNDGHGGVATATTVISVQNVNRAPVANPGGPYSGLTNVPVSFSGTGSSDPDGDPLTYAWDFGDAMTGTGVTPSHIYAVNGTYTVDLTVQDSGSPPLSASGSTTATITAVLTPRIYTTGGNATIKLGSGKPTWCAQLEPVGGNFTLADVRLATLVMKYGAGQIPADAGKTVLGSDKDGNGISEIGASFSKQNLRTLFAGLPSGRTTVTVVLEADLQDGGKVSGSIEIDVLNTAGSALTASVSPNPLNPSTVLTFSTSKPGLVQVRLYDLAGRLVRNLADEVYATPGYHDIRIDGRGQDGERLASGVYFYSIRTVEGAAHGRLTILK